MLPTQQTLKRNALALREQNTQRDKEELDGHH